MAEIIANMPEFGAAGPVVKTLVMLVLLVPWLHFAPQVHRDATKLRLPSLPWNLAVLGAGAVGVLVWLLMPYYLVGLLFYLVLSMGGLLAYAGWRDGRVDESKKILKKDRLLSAFKRRKRQTIELLTKVTLYDHIEKVVLPPDMTTASVEEMETYNRAQELLHDVVWRRASDVAIMPAPGGQQCRVLYVIDGVATERSAMGLAATEAVAQFLKAKAGLDVDDRRRPQTGTLSVDLEGSRADMEFSTAGTTGGQRLMFRIMQEAVRTRIDELGMPEDILEEVRKLSEVKNGLFIVSGPRGNGVTSTLYSMLRRRDAFIQNVVTVEAAPAMDLENIAQNAYGDDARLPDVLTAALKEGLDALMVDNCSGPEAAALIVKAAAKRPVLLGMQASDSFVALAKWVKLCGDSAAAVRILRGVMCQMLLRKLCGECRQAYEPDPKRLARLNLGGEKIEQFYRPPEEGPGAGEGRKGEPAVCPSCQGSGYRGRTAAFELLQMTNDIRQLIAGGATVAQIRTACRKNKMLYLQEQALRKVIDGTTSVQELVRIAQQPKKK